MTIKRAITTTAAIACVFALAGCAPTAVNPTSTGGPATSNVTLVSPGTLTVCTNVPFKPMEFQDDSGAVVGFDLDMMNLVAAQLGVTVTPVETDFDQITSGAAMAAQKCDIGASAITITAARAQAVNFSKPYFEATQGLAAKADAGINGLADLKGKNVAVESDTTGADYANQYANQYGYTVVAFDDAGAALNAILAGRVDACLVDLGIVTAFVNSTPSTVVATTFSTGETYGFVAQKTDNGAALTAVVNQALDAAVASGAYLAAYQKWIDPSATSISLPTS